MEKNRIMVIFSIIIGLLLVLACSISFPPSENSTSSDEELSPKPNGNGSEMPEPIQAGFPSGSDFTYIKWKCGEEYAPAGLPVGLGYKWAASTTQQVQNYLDAVTHQVEINGSPYTSPAIFSEIMENKEDGYFYTQVYIYFGDLKPGKYEFQTIGSFKEKVFDGEFWSGPGTDHPSFEGSCTVIVEPGGGQMAAEPQPQEPSEGNGNKESAPPSQQQPQQQPQQPPQQQPAAPKQESPLTFTFSPDKGCNGIDTEVTLTLSRKADVVVYYDGKEVPKKILDGGKKLIITILPSSPDPYIELKEIGTSIRSKQTFPVIVCLSMSGPLTDLAVTDLYPDNQPKGEVFARITCHGPESLEGYPVELACQARLEPRPIIGDINTKKQIKLTIKPGETQRFDTGIHTETDAFMYSITCELIATYVADSNLVNNTYFERIP